MEGYVHQSLLFLRQGPQPVMQAGRLGEDHVFPLFPERRHRVCNRFIETAVQRAEFICLNVGFLSHGKISNCLADVPIVMDDLINRVSRRSSSVPCRA